MNICFVKSNLESSAYVINGIGILSAIGKQYGHTSIWLNVACPPMSPSDWFSKEQPDVIALTACSDAYPSVVDTVRAARLASPKSMIWVGGPHATYRPEDFERIPEIDYIVRGEGELLWEAFCRDGTLPAERVSVGPSPASLDALPFVDRTQERDFAVESESPPLPLLGQPGPYRCILVGRGCRFNCKFCKPGTDLIFGKNNFRRRSVDHAIAELNSLHPFGSLFIHDDNLLEDEPWCNAFLQKWDGRPFLCQGHPSLMARKPDLLARMVQGGLRAMLIGFESGSDKVLKNMRKGTTRAINIKAAEIGHRLNIHMQANMIFGTPGETKDDVEQSLTLIKQHLQPCTVSPCVYTPYPGSTWGDECASNGMSLVSDTYAYGRGLGGRKLDEARAFDYTYDWLYARLQQG